MIIIKVQGGLGNQLLQYSIGRIIASRFHKNVAFDISFFDQDTKYTKRPYLLPLFNTTVRIATADEIEHTRYPHGVFSRVQSKITRGLNKYIFKKYYIGYDKNFFTKVEQSDTLYLEGFWQGYKYYENDAPLLMSEVALKDITKVTKFKEDHSFDSKVSVSVHVRRGDFLRKNAGTKFVPNEYYEQAVPLLETTISNPTYFIFSDDVEWVKESLGHLFKDVVYVSGSGLSDSEEFELMKVCNHAILSNSTFCWLPTLMTNRKDKVVIYPNNWENEYLNKDPYICPPEWKGV